MKGYICIIALLIAMTGITIALSGCDTKVTQTSTGGGTPVVVVVHDQPDTEPEPETLPEE